MLYNTSSLIFLSTLSLRRATSLLCLIFPLFPLFLSTLSLRRATNINNSVSTADKISIHALLAESDAAFCQAVPPKLYFYPRSPCGERRRTATNRRPICFISIHALLAESDRGGVLCYLDNIISIHALLAESDNINNSVSTADKISIHALGLPGWLRVLISIHALLAESDPWALQS